MDPPAPGSLCIGLWDDDEDHIPVGLLKTIFDLLQALVSRHQADMEDERLRAERAEQMLEGATGNLRALILEAAGEMARLRRARQAGQHPPSPTQQDGERHGSGSSSELERRWEELLRRERAVEERERELNLRMRVD